MHGDWWYDNIIEPGKLPMLLCLAAFVVTFILTRVITRMIRAGIGPFKNNVSRVACTSITRCRGSSC